MVPVATGTDGFGSIRLPAVACNLVGLKVTRGLLPQSEGAWDWSSVDGFLTRTVRDAALAIDLVSQPDTEAWIPAQPVQGRSLEARMTEGLPPLRIGVLETPPNGARVAREQADAAEEVAVKLAGAGHCLSRVQPRQLRIPGLDGYRRLVAPAWSHLRDVDLDQPADAAVQERLRSVEGVTAVQYVRAVADLRAGVRAVLRELLASVDLLLTPLTGGPFPDHGVVRAESGLPPDQRPVTDSLRGFVDWVNVLGLPAIALPTHRDVRGVAYGVQLVGAPHSEASLLHLAGELETDYRWHHRELPEGLR
jgi:amidase